MKDMIQRMTEIENSTKKELMESTVAECGMGMPAPGMNQGTPVSINVSLNASGKEHVQDLIDMMKNAGLGGAQEVSPAMMPMRLDIEKFRDTVDAPKALPMPSEEVELDGDDTKEQYANEPDEAYGDTELMTKDLSGGINRQKKMFKPAAKGDNPMAVESIKEQLYALLAEKKAKPDFLDMDKDGNKKEPMKKAVADKKKNPFAKKEKVEEEKSSTGGEIDRSKKGITKHTENPKRYSDEPHAEPKSQAKSKSAAEKKGAPEQKKSKTGTWGMEGGKKFDNTKK